MNPLRIVLLGVGILIGIDIFIVILELLFETIIPTTEIFFSSFIYLVIDWFNGSLILLLLVYFLLKKINANYSFIGLSFYRKTNLLIIIFFISFVIWNLQNLINDISLKFLPENYPANSIEDIINKYTYHYQRIILFIMLVIIIPISEEIFFRGFCYRILRNKYKIFISILINTIIFLVFHPVISWILTIIIVNTCFCLIYEKTKFIGAPILMHAFLNMFEFIKTI